MKIKLSTLALSVVLLLTAAGPAVSQTSISISNNSFEFPASGGQQIYISGTGATSTFVNGWTTATTAGYWDLQYTNNTAGVTNKDGLQLLESYDVGGGLAGVVYQELTNKWVAGTTYTLTARAGQATNSANTPNTGDTFSIDANNGGTLTQLSSTTITNAKVGLLNYTVTYAATGSEPGDGHVVVAFHVPSQGNTGGMWIDDFALTSAPTPDPSITTQPASQTTYLGQTISFTSTAVGLSTLSYQWQATNSAGGGFTNLVNGGQISGATSNVLTIAGVTDNWALSYRVIVTDANGSVTSSPPAVLTILSGSPPFRLMPLGDSITRGSTDPNYEYDFTTSAGYRDGIYTLSTNGNVNFLFVGAATKQASPQLTAAGQQHHNGYGSYTTGDLFTNLTASEQPSPGDPNVGGYWMTSGTPGGAPVAVDVVTLLSGANDIGYGGAAYLSFFTNNEIKLLTWFKSNRPNAKVIVATDLPRTDSTANNNAALAINQWITNTVPTLSTNFSTTDLYHLFIDGTGAIKSQSSPDGICLQDGVHPAHNGYLAMGQVWFNAIQAAVNPTAPNFLSAAGGINSQVTLNWTNVPGALGYNVKMSTTGGGPYSLIASNLSTASYTNNGLANGTTYYYVVSAVFSGGEGPNSYQVNATPGSIPIVNHSFDNNYVAYSSYLGSAPAGWTFNGPGNGQTAAVVFPASNDTRFTTYPVTGLDGLMYAQIFVNGTAGYGSLYLNTGYNYVAGATYKLTAGFGREGGTLAGGAKMMLQNPGFTTLAATNITTANTTANQFTDVSTTYTANGTEGNIVIDFAIPAAIAGNAFFDIDNVRLTVVYPGAAPIITTPPASQAAVVGGTAAFNVVASGVGTLAYQWQATNSAAGGFTNIVGATTNVLTLVNVTTNQAMAYQVIVTNANGSVTSAPPASLTVLPKTVLINGDFGPGATQIGSAVLGAPGDVWNAIAASTGLLVNSSGNPASGIGLTLSDFGVYQAAAGTVTDPGTTNLMEDYAFGYSTTPMVMANITGLAPYVNSAFTLVVYAAGNAVGQGGSLTLTGATGGNALNTLTTTAVSRQISAGVGVAYNTYTGILTNGTLTITSVILPGQSFTAVNGFQLLLSPAADPAIYSSPQSQTIAPGGNASFSVTAVGTSPFSYQWQINTGTGFTNLINGGQISGATNATLTVFNVLPWANPSWVAAYQVIVSNSVGSVTSAPASLNCPYVAPGGNVQAAINQAFSNGGGQVNLGPGTYNGNIVMYGGVTLNGAGSNTIIAASTISGPQNNSASGYTVQNLVIDGQISCSYFSIGAGTVSGVSGLPGIQGGNPAGSPPSYNLTYRNLEVKNCSIGMQCWSVYGLLITNCNFHDDGVGFSHNIYLVGCPGFQIVNSTSSWSRTGDALHLDFASDTGYTNSFIQCEFDGVWGIGILDQAYNSSANYTKMKGCGIKYGGQSGGDGTGLDIDYTGDIQSTRFEYNHGNGATIRGSAALLYDAFSGNSSAPYFSYAVVSNVLSGGTGANIYHATLANGVTGPNNTADWVTTYGGQTEGAVDFNANHALNGSLTWPNVSSTSVGTRQLSLVYANGTSTNVSMKMIVNGGATNTLTFPPTGGWSTYSSISSNVTLTAANNTVQMLISSPGAICPILSALVVNDSTPSVPAAPTGLTYLALTNAPKYDLSCWIRLSWNTVSGATYYNLKRNGLFIATGIPTNGFTDYHVPFTGTAFTYTVVPVNAGGAGSGTTITSYSLTGFPVTLAAATNGPGSVTLTCSWSTNAPIYNAYRSSVSGGPYSFIGSTGLTTNITSISTNYYGVYTDVNAPGGTNYYVMTAYNGITESLYSPEAAVVVTAVAPSISTNAYLASLALYPAMTFTPVFASNVLIYAATEAYGTVPTVTVTNADLAATNQLIYNGITNILVSGTASTSPLLNLTLGVTNVVLLQVTAQDGVTVQTYTVNVTELPNQTTQPILTNSVGNGMLNLNWGPDRLGYRLLVQTNNLNLGVSPNLNDWDTVPGSTAVTTTNLPLLPGILDEYYRLVYP